MVKEYNGEEIVYFELNHWCCGEHYPDSEPFITWMCDTDKEYSVGNRYLSDPKWVKEHKICVRKYLLDMSVDFLVTAPMSFVKEVCPTLLEEKNNKFFRDNNNPEFKDENAKYMYEGRGGIKFMDYTEDNIGVLDETDIWL